MNQTTRPIGESVQEVLMVDEMVGHKVNTRRQGRPLERLEGVGSLVGGGASLRRRDLPGGLSGLGHEFVTDLASTEHREEPLTKRNLDNTEVTTRTGLVPQGMERAAPRVCPMLGLNYSAQNMEVVIENRVIPFGVCGI